MKKIIGYILGVFILFSCNDPFENQIYTAYEELPAASYLDSNPEHFSKWSELLRHAGLYNALNLQTIYTVFVPNNTAVENFLLRKGLSNVTDLVKDEAELLVKYHLLNGISLTQSQFENGVIRNPTATEDNLSIEFREGGLNSIYINGIARVAQMDIHVTNGVMHEIEEVLEPITETILDRLKEKRFSIFYDAVVATGYQNMLNTIHTQATDANGNPVFDHAGNPVMTRFRYTAFAVPNEVYAKDNILNLEVLKYKLGVSGTDYSSPDNELNRYVAYHILSQLRSFSDLANFPDGSSTMNINTLNPQGLLSLTDVSGSLIINYKEGNDTGVNFIQENINCKNGVVHEIDDWMPVFTPPKVTVLWDFADYPELAAIATTYQREGLTTQYTRALNEGDAACYTWRAMPSTRTGVVTYVNSRTNDGVFYSTHNWDFLRVELGTTGWLEMQSPVLIKGKYKITIFYVSANNTGNMLISFDGDKIGGTIMTNNSSEAIRSSVLSSSYEFEETSSHTLRIVSIDGRRLNLDYILFEPVE